MAEVENDVINKRLHTCSTYSGRMDLRKTEPADYEDIVMENNIYVLHNQFGYRRDIIAGEAEFRKYTTEQGAFISYKLHNVLENHYFMNSIEFVLEQAEDRMVRCLAKIDPAVKKQSPDTEKPSGYIDDLIDIQEEQYYEWIEEDRETIRKFNEPITAVDNYREHIYIITKVSEENDDFDYTKLVYNYPLAVGCLGAVYKHREYVCKRFRYDELFNNGMDMDYLLADYVETDNFGGTLACAFAYD